MFVCPSENGKRAKIYEAKFKRQKKRKTVANAVQPRKMGKQRLLCANSTKKGCANTIVSKQAESGGLGQETKKKAEWATKSTLDRTTQKSERKQSRSRVTKA